MESFSKLFGSLLALVYHCFDRIVIQGYMPLLTRPEHIVHFFRDVYGIYPITKQALAKRTNEYQRWVARCGHPESSWIWWPLESSQPTLTNAGHGSSSLSAFASADSSHPACSRSLTAGR